MNLSPHDLDLMVRTVLGEALNEPDTGKSAVAHVIMNRLKAGEWGKTPGEIVLAKGQFEPWQTRARELLGYDPKSTAYQNAARIVNDVVSGKIEDPTKGATYFLQPEEVKRRRGGTLPNWATGNTLRIGNHAFYYGGRGGSADSDVAETAKILGLNWRPKQPAAEGATSDAKAVSPKDVEDTLKAIGIVRKVSGLSDARKLEAAPTQQPAASPGIEPGKTAPLRITVGGPKLPGVGYGNQILEGIPLVAPMFNKAVAATTAGLEPLVNMAKGRPTEDTFGERYAAHLAERAAANKQFTDEHPIGSAVANVVGGTMALGPLARLTGPAGRLINRALGNFGENLGLRALTGLAGGATIGGSDAYLRGEDPKAGAVYGGAGGAIGPVVSEAARGGTNLLLNTIRPRPGPLQGMNTRTVGKLTEALEGETFGSLRDARTRMGPAGMVGDINTGTTDLMGGVADIPGPGKQVVRDAIRQQAAGRGGRVKEALNQNIGPVTNVEEFKNFLTETRKAAADPLYKQWRTMQVQPTDKLKELIPRLEKAGAFDMAEELSGISGNPINKKFFTPGDKKDFPTTEAWDYVKRGLDRRVDQAYRAGDKTLARELLNLKHEMIDEIGKTKAGKVWEQARREFAERSAILDQIDAGRDTFLGGRSGLSADELREELKGIKGPELAARLVGMRSAVDEAMGASVRGDTQVINKLLAPNNVKKMELLVGKDATKRIVDTLEQERYLMAQQTNTVGNSTTSPKQARRDALLPEKRGGDPWPMSINLMQPLSILPPSVARQFSPSVMLEAVQARKSGDTLNQLAKLLTVRSADPEYDALIRALRREGALRGRTDARAAGVGSLLNATALPVSTSYRRSSAQ